jgi:hypothetical protein
MNIILPSFKNKFLKCITACGNIDTNSEKILDLLKSKQILASKYNKNDKDIYFIISSGGKAGKHLHIDCVMEDFVDKKKVPKSFCTLKESDSFLSNFEDLNINVSIRNIFILPESEISDCGILKSLMFEQKSAELSIKAVSGSFEIKGAPINKINWIHHREKPELFIEFEAEIKEKINPQYLIRASELIENQYNIFVTGKVE